MPQWGRCPWANRRWSERSSMSDVSMFNTNGRMLADISTILSAYKRIYWVIGGACTGKSTVCKAISAQKNIAPYDMDEHIYGTYTGLYTVARHPAIKTWFSAANPLEWALSLSWDAFNSLNRAATVEYLDLFAKDAKRNPTQTKLLVDGGVTHPSILTRVIPPERIFCIKIDAERSAAIWNEDASRAPMKEAVLNLPQGEKLWRKFLDFDRLIAETIVQESRSSGIRVFDRDERISVSELSNIVVEHLCL